MSEWRLIKTMYHAFETIAGGEDAGSACGEDVQKKSTGVFGNASLSIEGFCFVSSTMVCNSVRLGSLHPVPRVEQYVIASLQTCCGPIFRCHVNPVAPS